MREKPPERTFVFFIDRCLGTQKVAAKMREVGAEVEVHDDHFPQDCPDHEWLANVSRRGWLILTQDKAIRRREVERAAIRDTGGACFWLTCKRLDGDAAGEVFARAKERMMQVATKYGRPVLATVSRSGVTVIEGERRGGIRRER